jgi:arginase family enzyme
MSNAFSFAVPPIDQNQCELPSGTEHKIASNTVSVGATVSSTATARMETYAMGAVNVPQQTRHARRIYVGGLPPNFIDEDGLRGYLNSVVAQGLGEENDHSYVLSVYINHKKCFAFIELKSIELATACLALDGIMLKNVALRILRANEYKPELVPASMNKVINFNLSGFQFGNPMVSGVGLQPTESDEGFSDRTFDALIQTSNFLSMDPGTVVIVGYPYDENPKKTVVRGSGCAAVPKTLRNVIRRFKFGVVDNAEYESDMSKLRVLDVGDVLGGKIIDECRSNLTAVVTELLKRGGIPVIIGGSNDLLYPSVKGASTVSKAPISVISLGSKVDSRLFDDFSQSIESSEAHFVENRVISDYALFGAQGNILHAEEARNFISKGGHLIWLKKDLRKPSQTVEAAFQKVLDEWKVRNEAVVPPGVIVHIDCGSLDCNAAGCANSSSSTDGLKYEEVLQIAYISGRSPMVSMIQITEFSPLAEENRHNMLVLELLYYFCVGYNLRIEGNIGNFCSPLGISTSFREELKFDSETIDLDFASRLTSMVPPASTVPTFVPPSESMTNSVRISEDSNMMSATNSSLASLSITLPSNGSNPSQNPVLGGFSVPSHSPDADTAGIPSGISLVLQQQQQQAMLNRLPNRPSSLESSPIGVRQQYVPHSSNGMSLRTFESNPSNGASILGTSPGGTTATNGGQYGRTLLEMKVASGQIPYMITNQAGASIPTNSSQPETFFANSSNGIAARNISSLTTSVPGLRGANNATPGVSGAAPSSQNIHATLSRSTSSRSAASNSSGNNMYVAGNSRSTGASFSGSSMASSAQSFPSLINSGVHSMTQSPNGSTTLLGTTGHLAHLPPHPPQHHLQSIQAPHLHHVLRRSLYHQESHNQSSIDLGQDPHPFDEATDLNFDLTKSSPLKTSNAMALNHSNNPTNLLGHGSSISFKMPTGASSVSAVASPSSNYGGSEFLLKASTKSNSQGSLGFCTSTDTNVNGSTFPHLMTYMSSIDAPQQQLQQQQAQSIGLTNSSFYSNPSSSLNTNASGLLGFGK